ncbi:MAG: hypothetical protein K2N91_08820, partial [Muribaculaceae bacterium]|nr:hypothetical protein [Muribaculaceae bacterium]
AALLITAIAMHAEFNRLVFRTIDGNVQSIGLTDLNITFSDAGMIATADGESVEIALNSLVSMEFENNPADVNEIAAHESINGKVSVYTADGKHIGDYDSFKAASIKLPGGIYLVKAENGITSKVKINL